jgi:hypothetical protein
MSLYCSTLYNLSYLENPSIHHTTDSVSYGTAYMFRLLNHEDGSSKLLRIDGVLSEYIASQKVNKSSNSVRYESWTTNEGANVTCESTVVVCSIVKP